MGHFSHTCKLSGVPITGGTPVALFPLAPNKGRYDNSEESLFKYGTTYQCSNDGLNLKFYPVWLPIIGTYDDYGGIEDIVKDESTQALEEYFGLSIEDICGILTSGRKDDGYDGALKAIKDPDKADEYGNPQYKERYKELLSISGMWVHGEVYQRLTANPTGEYFDKIDLGNQGLLESLGFERIEDDEKEERYKQQYSYKGEVINSDGTWVNLKGFNKYSVYDLKALSKYMKEERGVELEGWEKIDKKDAFEQMVDTIFPKITTLYNQRAIMQMLFSDNKEKIEKALEILKIDKSDDKEEMVDKAMEALRDRLEEEGGSGHHMNLTILYKLLNNNRFGGGDITNPMTEVYFQKLKEGGTLVHNFVKFWRFHHYLWATGTYFEPVGTAPQDGEHEAVYKVLQTAIEVLKPRIEEIEAYRKEEEEEEA